MVRRRSPVRSRPSAPAFFIIKEARASVAQLVEHVFRKDGVAGSIPAAGSIWIKKK